MNTIGIRPLHEGEGEDEGEHDRIAAIWYRAGRDAYPYLPGWQTMTADLARDVFSRVIVPLGQVFVAELDGVPSAFLVLSGSYIDRLYVDPPVQGRGLGHALLEHARALSPAGLELHTHVQNERARAFYEARGFVAVRFGTSPPPESAPDVEYHWRP